MLQSFGTVISIRLTVLLILSTTIMSGLLLRTSWSVWIRKFYRILVKLFSATCSGWCWYRRMYLSINPWSSSTRTWMYLQTLSWLLRYFVGERLCQHDMWWMFSFSTQHIWHVSSSSTLKTCFLIYLVEITCSWMAAIVDSLDLFRVKDFNHCLNRALSTWGWSRYFANFVWMLLLLSSASSLSMREDMMMNFPQQVPHGGRLLNIMANLIYLPVWF